MTYLAAKSRHSSCVVRCFIGDFRMFLRYGKIWTSRKLITLKVKDFIDVKKMGFNVKFNVFSQ